MKSSQIALPYLMCLAFAAGPAAALDFTMNFDGPDEFIIPSAAPNGGLYDPSIGSSVLGYYNGDTTPSDPPFPREGRQFWNTTFSDSAYAVCTNSAGPDCQGFFPLAKSKSSAVIAVEADSFYFEVSPGLYVTKLSFFYGADGTGSDPAVALYAGSTLVYKTGLKVCSGGGFCGWEQGVIPESELLGNLITKVEFFGASGKVAYDDISVTTTPIPEPSTYALMLGGLALIAGAAHRRRA